MKIRPEFKAMIASYEAPCLEGLADALEQTDPEVSIRLNPQKAARLATDLESVAWSTCGYYLPDRAPFTFDPALHQGLYYVQDASSMSVEAVVSKINELEGGRPLTAADACAAPGGKTTAIISSLPEGSLVVANEYDYRRAAVLAENIAKWGSASVMVTRGDTSRFASLQGTFDVIAADVPCSGEGMMRKDEEAAAQWSPALVEECAARQREIIENLWPALHAGGYLIYSTCTFNRRENEEIVDWICSELGGQTIAVEALDAADGIEKGIATGHHCYRFIPGRARGEGLFISLIRKDGDAAAAKIRPAKKPKTTLVKAPAHASDAARWLTGDYKLMQLADNIVALPAQHARTMVDLAGHLDVLSAGVTLGVLKGRDLIPDQALALSQSLNTEVFASKEVEYQQALAYLRREGLVIDDAPRGLVLLKYRGRPLGFVKNLGNRANNLYPQPWRILSTNLPTEAPHIVV